MTDAQHTDLKQRLHEAAAIGAFVDVSDADDKDVPAELLVDLLIRPLAAGEIRRGVKLAAARIVGALDLEATTLVCPLRLDDCELLSPVTFARAQAPGIELIRCVLSSLDVTQARIRGNLDLRGAALARGVDLVGAHIGGQLYLNDVTLAGDSGPALRADGLQVDRSMFCNGSFRADGEVRLLGARVGGQLTFQGATLKNKCGPALTADRLRVEESVSCSGSFRAEGEVRLTSARVGGQLIFRGATLKNNSGCALGADGMQVDGSLFCDGSFRAEGEVRLLGARVGGQLSFRGATLKNNSGCALFADGLQVDRSLFCDGSFRAEGVVRLPAARVGDQLMFGGATLTGGGSISLELGDASVRAVFLNFVTKPPGIVDLSGARFEQLGLAKDEEWPTCRLRGCRYDALTVWSGDLPVGSSAPDAPAKSSLRWLAGDPDGYAPQPYEQLADVHRRHGDDESARQVLIAKQRRRRQTLAGPAKAWSSFLDVTVRYGHRLWLAGVWLIALAIVGTVLFGVIFDATTTAGGDLTPAKAAEQAAPFQPVLYAIDVLLPVISLGQDTSWNAHGAAQWATAIGTLLGWLLTTAFVAGLVTRRA